MSDDSAFEEATVVFDYGETAEQDEDLWFVAVNDQAVGPLLRDDLLRWYCESRLTPESLVWSEMLDDWCQISSVSQLLGYLEAQAARQLVPVGMAKTSPEQSMEEQKTQLVVDANIDDLLETPSPRVERLAKRSSSITPPPLPIELVSSDVLTPTPAKDAFSDNDWWDQNRGGTEAGPQPKKTKIATFKQAAQPVYDETDTVAAQGTAADTSATIEHPSVGPVQASISEVLPWGQRPRRKKRRWRGVGGLPIIRPLLGVADEFFRWIDDVSSTQAGLFALIAGGAFAVMATIVAVALLITRFAATPPVMTEGGTVTSMKATRLDTGEDESHLGQRVVQFQDTKALPADPFETEQRERRPAQKTKSVSYKQAKRANSRRYQNEKQSQPVRRNARVRRDKSDSDTDPIEDESSEPVAEAKPVRRRPLPTQLSPQIIRETMRELNARVRDCFFEYRQPGTISLQITVEPNGLATSSVVGAFRGSDTAACISAGVPRLRFPQFSGEPMTFVYPFRLRAE